MSRTDSPDVSIVVPVYDEEANVARLCAAIREALAGWPRSYEMIAVDDGSRDATLARLREQQRLDPNLRVVALRANQGQTGAMARGFAAARGRIVISMDGDLQNDPRDIPLLVDTLERGYDLVCGWRRHRRDAWLSRVLPSRVANWIIARLTGIPIHDNGCSLKAYRGDLIRALRLYSDMHRFLPALSSLAGARIAEVEVRHHPRLYGRNKYGLSRTFGVVADIVTIKMLTRFASRPGMWFARLALPWLALGVAALVAWSIRRWFLGAPASVVLPAAAMLSVYVGGQLFALAVLSEIYLAHADRGYLRRLVETLTVGRTVAGPGLTRESRQ